MPFTAEDVDAGRHCHLAIRFTNVMEQDIQHIARTEGRLQNGSERRAVAARVAELCRSLTRAPGAQPFVPDEFEGPDLQKLARRVLSEFSDVLEDAFGAGGFIAFDFGADFGAPATEEYQRCWTMCDPDSPVTFVVIPGYVVDGQRFSHQVVFTESADRPNSSGRTQ